MKIPNIIKKIKEKNDDWGYTIFLILVLIGYNIRGGFMHVTDYLYYVAMVLLSGIIGGLLIYRLKLKKENFKLELATIIYIFSYVFVVIYDCFALFVYYISDNSPSTTIESPLTNYAWTSRSNYICYEIENKTCTYIYWHPEKYRDEELRNPDEFQRAHRVIIEAKKPLKGIYWVKNVRIINVEPK